MQLSDLGIMPCGPVSLRGVFLPFSTDELAKKGDVSNRSSRKASETDSLKVAGRRSGQRPQTAQYG